MSASTVSGQTEPGLVLGTAGYLSPEQAVGMLSARVRAAFLALCAAATARAQTTGGIEGGITDSSGAPLSGVTVEATSPNLQGTRTSTNTAPENLPATIYDPNQEQTNPYYGNVTGRYAPRSFRAAVKVSF